MKFSFLYLVAVNPEHISSFFHRFFILQSFSKTLIGMISNLIDWIIILSLVFSFCYKYFRIDWKTNLLFYLFLCFGYWELYLRPLSANPTKWSKHSNNSFRRRPGRLMYVQFTSCVSEVLVFSENIKWEHLSIGSNHSWISLTLSRRMPLSYRTSPLICATNQWTGFYTITASVLKGLILVFLKWLIIVIF